MGRCCVFRLFWDVWLGVAGAAKLRLRVHSARTDISELGSFPTCGIWDTLEAVCISRPEAARRTESFASGQAYAFRTVPSPPPPSPVPPRPPKGPCHKCETLPICPISPILVGIPGSLLCLEGNWTSVLVIALRPQPKGEGRGRRRGRAGKHGERGGGERGISKGKGERN